MTTEPDRETNDAVTVNKAIDKDEIDLKRLTENLGKIIGGFEKEAGIVDEFIDPIVASTESAKLFIHLMLYRQMEYLQDVCEALNKMCNKNMPIVAERAEKMMTQEMLDSVNFMGKKWSVGIKSYAQVSGANKPACVEWLKGHPTGKTLVDEGYHPASLQKWVNEELIAKGQDVPPFISVFNKRVLNSRKVAQ